jgi:hypothetical protein
MAYIFKFNSTLFFVFFFFSVWLSPFEKVHSQDTAKSSAGIPVSAVISLSNEGISIIPAFGLGEPAVLTSFSAGNRFRFEPEFYFSTNGDPWAFLLWLRYDLLRHERFAFRIGMHPGYTFLKSDGNGDGTVTEVVKILAGELTARYQITEKSDVGLYYLRGGALDGAFPQESHFLSLNSILPGLNLSRGLRLTFLRDPWAFLLWLRYDLLRHERFTFRIGMHPGYTFLKSDGNGDGTVTEVVKILAGELTARYQITEKSDVGLYYLRGGALDGAFPQESHFLSLNSILPGLNLSRGLRLTFLPQIYYLKIEDSDGFYAASTITLGLDGFPLTLSSVINKIIESDITGNDDPLWNISLNYSITF